MISINYNSKKLNLEIGKYLVGGNYGIIAYKEDGEVYGNLTTYI
ncbi:hypothetical protein [Mammaliicoccus sp. E-M21]|nr:hypothetical protein [Mammaliicoccus sp. E-M21]